VDPRQAAVELAAGAALAAATWGAWRALALLPGAGRDPAALRLRDLVLPPGLAREAQALARLLRRRGVVQGVLISGPRGCGRTALALALCAEGRRTAAQIDAAALTHPWAGTTQELLRRAFAEACDAAPSSLVIEHADTLHPEVAALMAWEMDGLRERGEDVAVIATADDPSRVSAPLRDRLPHRLGVRPPGVMERAALLRRSVPRSLLREIDPLDLALQTDNWTHRQVLDLARRAEVLAMAAGEPLGLRHLQAVIREHGREAARRREEEGA
jgi:SpoVK/Ycf46/Vps4 family AAA+-type ATPase